MENNFYDVATKKMASRGLPHSKTNVLQGLTTRKVGFRRFPQKWFLGLATWNMGFRGLPQRKWFLGGCHTENVF